MLSMVRAMETRNAHESNENIYEVPGPQQPCNNFAAIAQISQIPACVTQTSTENLYDDIVYTQNNNGDEIVRINGKEYLRLDSGAIKKSDAIRQGEREKFKKLEIF